MIPGDCWLGGCMGGAGTGGSLRMCRAATRGHRAPRPGAQPRRGHRAGEGAEPRRRPDAVAGGRRCARWGCGPGGWRCSIPALLSSGGGEWCSSALQSGCWCASSARRRPGGPWLPGLGAGVGRGRTLPVAGCRSRRWATGWGQAGGSVAAEMIKPDHVGQVACCGFRWRRAWDGAESGLLPLQVLAAPAAGCSPRAGGGRSDKWASRCWRC